MSTTLMSQLMKDKALADPFRRTTEQAEEYAKLEAAFNAEAKESWHDPMWKRQVAADFESVLDYFFRFENSFGAYLPFKTYGEFDRPISRKRRGLKVFETARGGEVNESQLNDDIFEYSRSTLAWHVSEFIPKLRANFGYQLTELAALAAQKMDAEVNRRILAMMQAAVPPTSPYYVASAGLTNSELSAAVRDVTDAWKPNGTTPMQVTILGRAAMIDRVGDLTPTFSPIATEEIRQRGFVGRYKGAQVMVLNNYHDEDGSTIMPANELWVLGGTVGEFGQFGGTEVKLWDENSTDYSHVRAMTTVGGVVYDPAQCRRVTDASISA